MNPEVKTKWIEALRSGEYKQGRYRLRNHDDTYCCLGVLCDLHAKETNDKWSEDGERILYHGAATSLPKIVCDWIGVPSPHPGFDSTGIVIGPRSAPQSLIMLNDTRHSFEQIADAIEKDDMS